jgi:hypothetical protein
VKQELEKDFAPDSDLIEKLIKEGSEEIDRVKSLIDKLDPETLVAKEGQ